MCLITLISRKPRQVVGYYVAFNKSPQRIQAIVDSAPPSLKYCTDGYSGYVDIIYPGVYMRNMRDKSDTFTVEGINANLRHYIPILARRSCCFSRKLETLYVVVFVFVDAYNQFGKEKRKYRLTRDTGELLFSLF